ncbi:MAG: hypothetical protein FJ221_12695 [Lentisphaerae bacterium]|nr:hypothetical protein [Lentisphaerota bacterium]
MRWSFMRCAAAAAVLAAATAGAADEPSPVPRRLTPTPPAPPPAGGVSFNFDNADIRILAKIVGEMTGRRFVVNDKVVGSVTVISPGQIQAAEVYPLFLSILESRGFTVIEREGASFIVPLPDTQGMLVVPQVDDGTNAPGRSGMATRIFRPANINAIDLAKAVEPLVRGAKSGGLSVFGPGNHLIVTETADSLRRIEQLIAELDRPGANRTLEVVRLTHGSAEELAQQVATALAGAESAGSNVSRHIRQVAEGSAAMPSSAMVVASPAANSLVLIGTPVQIEELKRIVALLDVEPGTGKGRLNAVFLKYLSAEEAAKSLSALLTKTVDKDKSLKIAVEPNIANNALLVYAMPSDFLWVRDLVESLDTMPSQVLVEILIAETDVGRQVDLGVDWSTIEVPGAGETVVSARSRPGAADTVQNMLSQTVFPQGLSLGVAHGSAGGMTIPFLLTALDEDRDVRILSSVPLLVQNNTEATVNVVENIPVLRSTIEGGAGTSRDVIQNIDRMDVGIKLKVTPHVNPNREITLALNPTIEAVTDQGSSEQAFAPTIAKREIKTTITVPDRSTVVISGLIREDKGRTERKIPLLGDIPWLGWLFRYSTDTSRRNNLLVFVTPRIVDGTNHADAVSASLEKRTGLDGVSAPQRVDPTAERKE